MTYSIFGLVTLYHPDVEVVVRNMMQYLPHIERLLVWDNSPLPNHHREDILRGVGSYADRIEWHGTGENTCIAPGINVAWRQIQQRNDDALLLMDQDSTWEDFAAYRRAIEEKEESGQKYVYTPYFPEHDRFEKASEPVVRRLFINSGTVLPRKALDAIGGANEAFPLDALDTDLSYQCIRAGYQAVCLSEGVLHHTIGQPTRRGPLHIFTNDYGRFRTYSITRGHVLCYRRHRDIMTPREKWVMWKEVFFWKIVRIILAEEDKWGRWCALYKGAKEGWTYPLS